MGIVLYLMVFGKYPFEGKVVFNIKGSDDEEILNNIVDNELVFPKEIPVCKSCKVLLESLLEKNPKERIDVFNSAFHDWFSEEYI